MELGEIGIQCIWINLKSRDDIMDCQSLELVIANPKEGASIEKASMIGMDLAKNSFQLHGTGADGSVAFRNKFRLPDLVQFR